MQLYICTTLGQVDTRGLTPAEISYAWNQCEESEIKEIMLCANKQMVDESRREVSGEVKQGVKVI